MDTLGGEKRSKLGGKTPSTPSEDEDRAHQDPFAPRQGSVHPEREASFAGSGQVSFQMVAGEEQQHPQLLNQGLHQAGYPKSNHSSSQKHHSELGFSGHER